jgi:hypothetical protein
MLDPKTRRFPRCRLEPKQSGRKRKTLGTTTHIFFSSGAGRAAHRRGGSDPAGLGAMPSSLAPSPVVVLSDDESGDDGAASHALSRSAAERIASTLTTQAAVDALCKNHDVPQKFAAPPAGAPPPPQPSPRSTVAKGKCSTPDSPCPISTYSLRKVFYWCGLCSRDGSTRPRHD